MKKNYQLKLTGFVGGWDFDAAFVDYTLDKHKDEEVNVLIDSLGGNIATALSVSSAFQNHGNVAVHLRSLCASAATIASMGAKKVTMEPSAMYLVHKCAQTVFEWGSLNADQLKEKIEELKKKKCNLEKFDENVAQMYAKKCKKTTAELLALMKAGGWLTAKEALEWGFVDGIEETDDEKKPVMTTAMVTAMAKNGIPLPNLPVQQEESLLTRLIEMAQELFGSLRFEKAASKTESKQTNNNTKMEMKKEIFEAAAGVESLTVNSEGLVTLTEEQVDAVEQSIRNMQTQMAKMQDENDALKQQPGAQPVNVVDTTKGASATKSPIEEMLEAQAAAWETVKNWKR